MHYEARQLFMTNNEPNREDPLHIEKEVHLLDYLHVIQRRWRIALILFLFVFLGVAAKTYLQIPHLSVFGNFACRL